MNNSILNTFKYFYYLSLTILLILYLFPGSLVGYFFYGNLGKQPELISNPIGTSLNHLIFFFILSVLSLIFRSRHQIFLNNIFFVFFLSIILELLHTIIPNRAFEFYDLFANIAGSFLGLATYKTFIWLKK
mgnify:CR=1 FL=1